MISMLIADTPFLGQGTESTTKAANFYVSVFDADGNPVPGVEFEVGRVDPEGVQAKVATFKTDESGTYKFEVVQDWKYYIKPTRGEGFNPPQYIFIPKTKFSGLGFLKSGAGIYALSDGSASNLLGGIGIILAIGGFAIVGVDLIKRMIPAMKTPVPPGMKPFPALLVGVGMMVVGGISALVFYRPAKS